MSIKPAIAMFCALSALAGPALAAPGATAQMLGGTGAVLGTATFTEAPTGVLIHLEVSGLKPGWHGVHLHEKGDCTGPAFTTAGAHMNHADPKAAHGLFNPAGPDFGDLPNIYVAADGKAMAELFSTRVSVTGAGGRASLLDADGSALMVHENADDQTTQPIGGAGARVACGVVKGG